LRTFHVAPSGLAGCEPDTQGVALGYPVAPLRGFWVVRVAISRKPDVSSAEELFEEVYRGEKSPKGARVQGPGFRGEARHEALAREAEPGFSRRGQGGGSREQERPRRRADAVPQGGYVGPGNRRLRR
jgi:hypothetical protein